MRDPITPHPCRDGTIVGPHVWTHAGPFTDFCVHCQLELDCDDGTDDRLEA